VFLRHTLQLLKFQINQVRLAEHQEQFFAQLVIIKLVERFVLIVVLGKDVSGKCSNRRNWWYLRHEQVRLYLPNLILNRYVRASLEAINGTLPSISE
jgi:hypothetical protein